jgi:hypothetical protein
LAERDWKCRQVKYKGGLDSCTDQFVRPKELVVELKNRLSDAKAQQTVHETHITSLPVPTNAEEIPSCLEFNVDCASKKGALLPSRVKMLCETVWSSGVYNGQ